VLVSKTFHEHSKFHSREGLNSEHNQRRSLELHHELHFLLAEPPSEQRLLRFNLSLQIHVILEQNLLIEKQTSLLEMLSVLKYSVTPLWNRALR